MNQKSRTEEGSFFDKRMVGKRGVEEAVASCWEWDGSDTEPNLMDCIAKCRSELAKLKRTENLNSKNRIDTLRKDLEKEISKQFPRSGVMRRLKQELAIAYRDEETFWRQRSKVEWLKEGDRNKSFFHNAVRGRRLRNKVLMLRDNQGNEQYSEGSKGNVAVEFFTDLFVSSNPFDMEQLFEGFPCKVTQSMNVELTKPISPEEIKRAAFGIKGDSAPGEDGLTGFFYQKYWHVVGQ